MIFAEHQKFSSQIPLLKYQITNLKNINKSWEKTDSIRRTQVINYYSVIQDQNKSIDDLNKSLKRKRNIIKYGGASSLAIILLCLLVK